MSESDMHIPTSPSRELLVFEGFKEHSSERRTSTEFTVLELLRKTYPEYHVTATSASSHSKCDLIGFAKAGHAIITLDESDELYDATRSYHSPGPRLEKKPGVLRDSVRFGRINYSWQEKSYIIYEVEWIALDDRTQKFFFVLSPRTPGTSTSRKNDATDALLLAVGKWSTELHEEIYVFDDGHWSKNKGLHTQVRGCSWDEVVLSPKVKAGLIGDVMGFFDNRELYKRLAVPWKRGLILHGVPGNGKTISIKALIAELSKRTEESGGPVPSLYVKNFDACQGQKYSIRAIFQMARSMAPCLLIFEDLDSLVTDKTRSYFLNEVDGLESNDGILMIGSTNHLETLDPAISKRPSRFDRKYHFKIPDEEERAAYCRFWKQKLGDGEMVDFSDDLCQIIAKITEGFSFAYLKELFVIALLTIARGKSGAVLEDEEEDGKSTGTNSVNEPVMVEHTDATSAAPSVSVPTTSGGTDAKKAEGQPKKRTLPEVTVPEHLKENLLLKVITQQLKILLEEMDNTPEENWISSKDQSSGVDSGMIGRMGGVTRFIGSMPSL